MLTSQALAANSFLESRKVGMPRILVMSAICAHLGDATQLAVTPTVVEGGDVRVSARPASDADRAACVGDESGPLVAQQRPIPTPCRNLPGPDQHQGEKSGRHLPPLRWTVLTDFEQSLAAVLRHDWDAAIAEFGPLVTLLEVSAQDPNCQAFIWTRLVVETCFEHFGANLREVSFVSCPGNARQPWPLQLHVLLPAAPPFVSDPSLWLDLDTPLLGHAWTLDAMPALRGHMVSARLQVGPFPAECTVGQFFDLMTPNIALAQGWELLGVLEQADICALRNLSPSEAGFRSHALHCFTDGSFLPATARVTAVCAWACVFICPRTRSFAGIAGQVPSWAFNSDRPSAYLAECLALIVGAWVSLTHFHHRSVELRSDCLSALGVFLGNYACPEGGVPEALRSLGVFSRSVSNHPPAASHIPGHRGHLGNEIADRLARCALVGKPCGDLQWSHDGTSPWWIRCPAALCWAGVAAQGLQGSQAYPPAGVQPVPQCVDNLAMSFAQLVEPFLPGGLEPAGPVEVDMLGQLELRMCSFNVLSLNSGALEGTVEEGLAFHAARPTLLASCLRDAGIHIAMLQETRTEEGVIRTQEFPRFASGACGGTLGVEIWILENHPLFTSASTPRPGLTLTAKSCVVAHKDPRRLLLRFRQGSLCWLLASLHAPHRAVEATVMQAWWAETNRLFDVHAKTAQNLMGGDMNAAVGSVLSSSIGDFDASPQDASGTFLAELLAARQLWLPCTFSSCHEGPSGTYVQKRNGAMTRIDYIACPDPWKKGRVRTWTETAIHTGQAYVDHVATCAHFSLKLRLTSGARSVAKHQFDSRALLTPEGRVKVADIMQKVPIIPWQVSTHAHAAALVKYLQSALAAHFPRDKSRRFRDYLTDDTWRLHRTVAGLRKHCTQIRNALRFHFLAAAFRAWQAQDGYILIRMLESPWTCEARLAGAIQGFFLGRASRELKAACKRDRAQHYSLLAEDVQREAPHAHKAVQRLLGLRRKKPFAPEVLPELCQADGTPCETPEDVVIRWREHFREQENGVDTAPEDLAAYVTKQSAGPSPSTLAELPSPGRLLQVIVTALKHKAAGPDRLPVELGHAAPQGLLQVLMPLLFKIGVTCTEPVGFKGGTLARLYKGRGSKTQCASYRAIMLLSTLAKLIHKSFRPSLYNVFAENALPAQLGGLKRTSVVLGSHITRAFGRLCASAGWSCVTLFADVASAYYTAVRALTARKPGDDDFVSPAAGTGELLREALAQPTAMTRAKASPWVEALTAELNSNTWMCLAGDSQPIVTRQGSRPGSSFADLFYGVTVPRILQWRDAARAACDADALGCDWKQTIRWDGICDFSPPIGGSSAWTHSADLHDVVWADDLAKCIFVSRAAQVGAVAALECGLLADAFHAHGYTLSFGPAKTAAIVAVRGAGSRAARRSLFSGKPELTVLREEHGAATLPLVTTYRHLGVKITSAAGMMMELRHRAAHAWAAYQQGRTKVFRCKKIALAKRGSLLATHVLTKLLFAAVSWPVLSKGEHSFFFRTVLSLFRQTLALPRDGDQHLTHATICALLRQPSPEILLLVERARYASQLVLSAPVQLWALLRRDPSYIAHVMQALQWVYGWVKDTSDFGDPSVAWAEWATLMHARPGLYKALIKRARGLELVRTACIAALQALRRAAEQLAGRDLHEPAARSSQFPEACLKCRIAFPSRTAWACHSSKLHGYRASSTLLVAGSAQPLCRACGRLYANFGRLKRHLGASERCRRTWGSFTPHLEPSAGAHAEAPPTDVHGLWSPASLALDPASFHAGLLLELQDLARPVQETVWEVVVGYVEPLQVLKETLIAWKLYPGSNQEAEAVAQLVDDTIILLDPELWCDDFREPRRPSMPASACPTQPSTLGLHFSFVTSGQPHVLTLPDPPLRAWVHPFRASVPLAAARRQEVWFETCCDGIGAALQATRTNPVRIIASPLALECLAPIPSWLTDGGFTVEPSGLRSPLG